MTTLKMAAAACVAAIAMSFAPAASAGECPAGQVGVNPLPDAATAPNRVTDNVIASIDLSERYGVPGRMLRLRKLIVEPGGVVPLHSHAERPANIYVVRGEITEYRSSCLAPIRHVAGDVVAEQGDIQHWWRNNSAFRAVLLSADIPPAAGQSQGGM